MLSLLLLIAATAPLISASSLRILPLGDSITKGCGSDAGPSNSWTAVCQEDDVGGYRAPLWSALFAAGFNTTMVGSYSNGPAWLPGYSRGHEGHPGITTRAITAILPTWAKTAPDIVLLTLGTNDLGQNRTLDEMTADMAALLSAATTALPRARMFLSTILKMTNSAHPEWAARVAAYNAALPALAAASPRTTLVDVAGATGLCNSDAGPLRRLCAECNSGSPPPCPPGYDRVHPTAAGYALMGGVWAAALLGELTP